MKRSVGVTADKLKDAQQTQVVQAMEEVKQNIQEITNQNSELESEQVKKRTINNAFFYAIKQNDTTSVKEMLERDPKIVNAFNKVRI